MLKKRLIAEGIEPSEKAALEAKNYRISISQDTSLKQYDNQILIVLQCGTFLNMYMNLKNNYKYKKNFI